MSVSLRKKCSNEQEFCLKTLECSFSEFRRKLGISVTDYLLKVSISKSLVGSQMSRKRKIMQFLHQIHEQGFYTRDANASFSIVDVKQEFRREINSIPVDN